MLIAISLWLTDMVHHVSPAVIGLGVGLFAVLPRVGVLDMDDLKRLNYLPVFFVAAAVSMGQVLASTKALDLLTNVMFAWMEPLMTNIYSRRWCSTGLHSRITFSWRARCPCLARQFRC